MSEFRRYALYYVPQDAAFYDRGAAWLGWSARRGEEVEHPDLKGLPFGMAQITETPRKYGFHGTLRAPFFLVDDINPMEMKAAIADLARTTRPAQVERLSVSPLGSFLALTPEGDVSGLGEMAMTFVAGLEAFRAPLSAEDRARRNPEQLSDRQRHYLDTYGYPFVDEDFRFHMTLTGRLEPVARARMQAIATAHFAHTPEAPYTFSSVTLCGEDPETRRFHVIQDYALSG